MEWLSLKRTEKNKPETPIDTQALLQQNSRFKIIIIKNLIRAKQKSEKFHQMQHGPNERRQSQAELSLAS